MRIFMSAVLVFLCTSCSIAGTPRKDPGIEGWMVDAFYACTEAQISIGNPMIDMHTRKIDKEIFELYAVDFRLVPGIPTYHMAVGLLRPYPDGAGFFCRLSAEKNVVLYALYYEGEPGSGKNRERTFVEHDATHGISEKELDALLEEGEVISFTLSEFLKHLESNTTVP